jgi:hypothetical protein
MRCLLRGPDVVDGWEIAEHRMMGYRYYCRPAEGNVYELRYLHRVGMYQDAILPPHLASKAGVMPAAHFWDLYEVCGDSS